MEYLLHFPIEGRNLQLTFYLFFNKNFLPWKSKYELQLKPNFDLEMNALRNRRFCWAKFLHF